MGIFKRFAFNPFDPLTQLLDKIDGCVSHIEPMIDANFDCDYEKVKDHFRLITQAEHEADEIKNQIRDGLARSVFMPIDRWHFLDIISAADKIADASEDIGYLLTIRKTRFPVELKEHFNELVAKALECYDKLTETVENFEPLVESGFTGPIADEVSKGIYQVCHLEWECDKISYKLAQHLFEFEDRIPVVDLFMIRDISKQLSVFADSCERLAKQIRRTLAT